MVQHPIWLAKPDKPTEGQNAEDIAAAIRRQWSSTQQDDSLREALLQIYARSAELLTERINRLPENYYRAFLNEAGVDLLPPKPARAEVTFSLPADGPPYVIVPAQTQVATQQSESRAEIIFETLEDLVVTPNRLVKCVTFDAHSYTAVTAPTTETANKTAVFGVDAAQPSHLHFTADGCFTAAGADNHEQGQPGVAHSRSFVSLFTGTSARERILFLGDKHFSYRENSDSTNGDNTTVAGGPAEERPITDFERQQTRFEVRVEVVTPIAFTLHGNLITELAISEVSEPLRQEFQRHNHGLTPTARIEGDNSDWCIVDGNKRYLIRKTEQTLAVTLLNTWQLTWYYWDTALDLPAWAPLASDQVEDYTHALQRAGVIRFTRLPALTKTKVGDVENYWLACQLTGSHEEDSLPTIKRIEIARILAVEKAPAIPIDDALAATQGGTIFTSLLPAASDAPAFLPFGPLPQRLDAFYLRADHAFQQAGAEVELIFRLESAPARLRELIGSSYEDKLAAALPQITWEYYSASGWQPIKQVVPKLIWGDLPHKGWGITQITHAPDDQQDLDTTHGFLELEDTHGILELKDKHTIRLTLGHEAPVRLTLNEQTGYWLRARIVEGAFGLPGELRRFLFWAAGWTPPVTFAPLIQDLTLKSRLPQKATFVPVEQCFSRIDQCWGANVEQSGHKSWRAQSISAQEWQKGTVTAWRPFTARDEGPALYLGFQRAFPAGQWLRLLFDVNEEDETMTEAGALQWQFWNGAQQVWQPLQPMMDDTKGLTHRNYLGFYAPADHGSTIEFGQEAYWLRAIPLTDQRPQVGVLGHRLLQEWRRVEAVGNTATVSLPKQPRVLTYKMSNMGKPETARANQTILLWQKTASASDKSAIVHIDASSSKPADGTANYIVRYHLRRARPKRTQPKLTPVRQLYGIRLNTVAVINKQTINEEVVGQSNGQANQRFTLMRQPVLDQVSNGNRYERFQQDPKTTPYEIVIDVEEFNLSGGAPATAGRAGERLFAGEAQWHEWQRINHFAEATQTSRVYHLDAIQGVITFGDGRQGVIPLASSKIRARQYCIHAGSDGNVGVGQITVLRNPTGELAKIEGVTNHEAASGGRATETVESAMERGPRAIKNQGRAVSAADLAWLARHSGADLVNAYPMPVCDQRGRPLAGHASLVILPRQLEAPTPMATAAQRRTVKAYLAQYLQANLQETDALTIRNPAYVMVDVTVWLAPKKPEQAEQLQRTVTDLLDNFLHPIKGGPQRHALRHAQGRTQYEQGWSFGRDLFVSQLYAQLESLSIVDYVNRITIRGSMLQYQLELSAPLPQLPQAKVLPTAIVIPAGAQVSTLDERKKLILSESFPLGDLLLEAGSTVEIPVHGFNRGDDLHLWREGDPFPVQARIVKLCADNGAVANGFTGRFKLSLQVDRNAKEANAKLEKWAIDESKSNIWVESCDGRLRLPLTSPTDAAQLIMVTKPSAMNERVGAPFFYSCIVEGLKQSELVSLFIGHRRLDLLWPVESIATVQDRVYIPDGYLVASGQHQINLTLAKGRL